MKRLVLVYNHPELGEQWHELEPGKVYAIGSREDNDIVLPQPDVSRRHAKLAVGPGSLRIVDLDSKNGTWIDGRRVTTATFRCGDPVMLSSARFVVVEMSSGTFGAVPDSPDRATPTREQQVGGGDEQRSEETVHHQSGLGLAEIVELMEHIAEGCRGGGAVPVLEWAVQRLEVRGALVIVRERAGSLGVVASAGNTGRLLQGGRLEKLLEGVGSPAGPGESFPGEVAVGESTRLVTVGANHLLVLDLARVVPADVEIRALRAALGIVLERKTRTEAGNGNGEVDAASQSGQFPGVTLADAVAGFERAFITRVLAEVGGHRQRAAERLGLTRAGLFKKMRRLGLTAEDGTAGSGGK